MSEELDEHVYINPDAEWQYIGDIQRIIPDWKIGDELPAGWHEVTNPSQPDPIFIYPEFGEGEDETNTAPIKQTLFHRELSVKVIDGVMTYETVWNPVTYDFVQEPPPHEIG
tara:strand:- start:1123 stop:1458 length:336 start_codon:yes stop_codon:yes gene_type:complete